MQHIITNDDFTLSLVCCSDLVRRYGASGLDGIFDTAREKIHIMRHILSYLESIEDYETCAIVYRELNTMS